MINLLTYPGTLSDVDLNPAWMEFQFFERRTQKTKAPSDIIRLYMPESAHNPSTVSWDTEKFGFVGGEIANAARMGIRKDEIGGKLGYAAKVAEYNALGNVGAAAAQFLNGQVSANALIGEVTGKIINPYLTMVFRGIDFRSFSFVFKFAPFSLNDCDMIDDILRAFRGNALSPRATASDPFLGYPKECEISYMWKNKKNKYLNSFKTAVCTAVDIDYTPNGMFSTMRNGFPTQIVMSTKWSEIEIVTRDDVLKKDGTGGY